VVQEEEHSIPVISSGVDVEEMMKICRDVAVSTPLGKVTCERVGCHGKTRRTEGYMATV
jgi:hypothetical protein